MKKTGACDQTNQAKNVLKILISTAIVANFAIAIAYHNGVPDRLRARRLSSHPPSIASRLLLVLILGVATAWDVVIGALLLVLTTQLQFYS